MAVVLGLDWGEARIGVARSDLTGTIAIPHGVVAEKDKGAQVERVVALAQELGAARLVMGMPYQLDGTRGPMAEMADKVATKLERLTGLEVVRWDERLTSVAAQRALDAMGGKRKKRRRQGEVDTVAACLLLQSYLDSVP